MSLVMLVLVGVIGVILWARSASGRHTLLGVAVRAAQDSLQGKLSVGRLEGGLTRDLVLHDVLVHDTEGQVAIRIDRIEAHYDLTGLLRNRLALTDVHIEGGSVHARTLRNGKLNLTELVKLQEEERASTSAPLAILVKNVSGELALEYEKTWRGRLRVDGSVDVVGSRIDAQLGALTLAVRAPLEAMIDASGGLHSEPGTLQVKGLRVVARTDGHQVDHLVPEAKLRGPIEAELNASGTLAQLAAQLTVRPARGEVRVEAQARLELPGQLRWQASAHAEGIDPETLRVGAPHGLVALSLDGRGEGRSGTLTLHQLTADLDGSHASAHGTITLGEHTPELDVQAEVKSPDLSRLASLGLTRLHGRVDARAHLVRRAGQLDIDADVSARRLAVASARIGRLELKAHTVNLVGIATVSARHLELSGTQLDSVELDAAGDEQHLTIDLDASGPHGAIARLRAHGVPLHEHGVALDLTVDQLIAGLRGQRWQTTRPGQLRFDEETARAQLTLADGAQTLSLDATLQRKSETLDLRLGGHALDLQKLARLAKPEADLTPLHGLPHFDVALDGRLARDRVRGTLDLKSAGPSLHAVVDVPTALDGARPLSADLTATHVDLDRLHDFLPTNLQALKGRVTASAALRGTTRKPELTAKIDAPDWSLAELEHARTALDLSYRDARLDARVSAELRARGGNAGSLAVSVHAPIELPAALRSRRFAERFQHTVPITVTARGQGLDVARLPLARLGVHTPFIAGKLDATVDLQGTLHEPSAEVRLTGHGFALPEVDQIDLDLEAGYQKRRATAQLTARVHGAPMIIVKAESEVDAQKLVDGEAWKDAPIRVDATVPSYDLSRLQKLSGVIAGEAALRGTLAAPTGKASLRGNKLKLGTMRFGKIEARAAFDGAQITAQADAAELPTGALHLDARVPLAADAPLALLLRADHLVVNAANLGALRRLEGQLDADLKVSGTRAEPVIAGRLRIDQGALAIANDPRLYQDLTVELTARTGAIELKKAHVKLGSGTLDAHGSVALAGLRPTRLEVIADANRFPFQQGNVGAWVDVHAELHGTEQDGKLTGELTLSKGTAHLPRLAGTRQLQSTGPLQDVVFVDAAAVRARQKEEKAKRGEATTTAEVIAHIPGPFHLRSPELWTDLSGMLELELVGGLPRITGHVETNGGRIELLGRRYQIERARVGFGGELDPNPTLDVRVTREITDTTVIIEVRGTAKKPELILACDPPIYDKSQIIGIIISGDPGRQQLDARSTDQKVVGAISGLLVNRIKDQIAPGLPIDVIRVDTGTDSTDSFGGLGTTRLEIGKYITENVFLSYVHQFGTPSGLHRQNSNEANLEYRFKRHFEIATRFGDAGVGSLDFYWTLRY
jgi:translocation and assembly module TamB